MSSSPLTSAVRRPVNSSGAQLSSAPIVPVEPARTDRRSSGSVPVYSSKSRPSTARRYASWRAKSPVESFIPAKPAAASSPASAGSRSFTVRGGMLYMNAGASPAASSSARKWRRSWTWVTG